MTALIVLVNMAIHQSKLSLRVQPNATRSDVVSFKDGVLQVKVAAPPIKGKANKELISLLSIVLGISKTSFTITKGHTSRNKVILVAGLNQEELRQRLSPTPSFFDDASI